MLEKIISGGQTGADQAALHAARAAGIATGGTAPKGWMTEQGPMPLLAEFGLVECEIPGYLARTVNILDSEATLIFEVVDSPGSRLTRDECKRCNRTFRAVDFNTKDHWSPEYIAYWIHFRDVRILNVASNRKSKAAGIEESVKVFMESVFAELKLLEAQPCPD